MHLYFTTQVETYLQPNSQFGNMLGRNAIPDKNKATLDSSFSPMNATTQSAEQIQESAVA